MRWSRQFLLVLVICNLVATFCGAESPEYPQRTPPERARQLRMRPWIDTIERDVPKLANQVGDRLPMIMWHGVGYEPLGQNELNVLRDRGFTQHLHLDEAMIPAAKVLQDSGMAVILMAGRTDHWPYSLADDWAHEFDVSYQPKWFANEDAFEWHGACPHKTDGWKILEKQTRAKLMKFRDAGIDISGVWMDYEGDPYPWTHLHEQLKHCRACRKNLPQAILNNRAVWRDDAWKRYVRLYDEHFAKIVREVYPDCLVTNWHVVCSSQQHPVRYFTRNILLPKLSPQYFNATNPIAYGCDLAWHELGKTAVVEPSAESVDVFYTAEMLQQVHADQANRTARLSGQSADAKKQPMPCIPWVARFCKIDESSEKTPIMSRAAYRAALSQIWKCNAASMQIFNPMHDGFEELALIELQDAVAAYDESLK